MGREGAAGEAREGVELTRMGGVCNVAEVRREEGKSLLSDREGVGDSWSVRRVSASLQQDAATMHVLLRGQVQASPVLSEGRSEECTR